MTATTHLIYFSPTGTTRKVVQEVARGLSGGETGQHDLTRQGEGANLHLTEGIAIIGTPVYAGRVPEIVLQRLAGLSGDGVPAVLVALYGNRAYEDCLVELRDVVAARAFGLWQPVLSSDSIPTPPPIAPSQSIVPTRKTSGRRGILG